MSSRLPLATPPDIPTDTDTGSNTEPAAAATTPWRVASVLVIAAACAAVGAWLGLRISPASKTLAGVSVCSGWGWLLGFSLALPVISRRPGLTVSTYLQAVLVFLAVPMILGSVFGLLIGFVVGWLTDDPDTAFVPVAVGWVLVSLWMILPSKR